MRNEELIVSHVNFAQRIATNMANATGRNSCDLESEAVFGLLQMGARFDGEKWRTEFRTFVAYGIVAQAKRFLRTRYQQPFFDLEDIHPDSRLELSATHIELRRRLKRFVGRLPAKQRLVIRLRYWDGMSMSEVAKETGMCRDWIFTLEHRALQRLKGGMERRGVHKVSDIL